MNNYKMYIPDTPDMPRDELSSKVQDHANKLGFSLYTSDEFEKLIINSKPFIYLDDGIITFGDVYYNGFEACENTEITPEKFLSLVPKNYRPYNDEEALMLVNQVIKNRVGVEYIVTQFRKRKVPLLGNVVDVKLCKVPNTEHKNVYEAELEIPLKTLLDWGFKHPDGSPCGVEVTE